MRVRAHSDHRSSLIFSEMSNSLFFDSFVAGSGKFNKKMCGSGSKDLDCGPATQLSTNIYQYNICINFCMQEMCRTAIGDIINVANVTMTIL